MTTDVQELIAESTLDSDAAMIDAITRPDDAGRKRQRHEVRRGSVRRVLLRQGCIWKYANSARPTNDSANIQTHVAGGVDDECPSRFAQRLRGLKPLHHDLIARIAAMRPNTSAHMIADDVQRLLEERDVCDAPPPRASRSARSTRSSRPACDSPDLERPAGHRHSAIPTTAASPPKRTQNCMTSFQITAFTPPSAV